MDTKFSSLPWHDAELLSIYVDRSKPGNNDTVALLVKWPDETQNNIIFNNCYLFEVKMNFGIIAEESILQAMCVKESDRIAEVKRKWHSLGTDLDNICCYQITTNSTSSQIDIYALSYELL